MKDISPILITGNLTTQISTDLNSRNRWNKKVSQNILFAHQLDINISQNLYLPVNYT